MMDRDNVRLFILQQDDQAKKTRWLAGLAQGVVYQDLFAALLIRKPESHRVMLCKNKKKDAAQRVSCPRTFSCGRFKALKLVAVEDFFNRQLDDATLKMEAAAEMEASAIPSALQVLHSASESTVVIPRVRIGRPSKREEIEARNLGLSVSEMRRQQAVQFARVEKPSVAR